MSVFSSLTNRIFIASAMLVLVSITVPVYFVIGVVTGQAEAQLRSSLDEAASLVDEYGRVGGRDDVFAARAEAMADLIGPNASVALVPGAGHAAHLEAPADFLAIVRPFLERAASPSMS